MTLRPGGSPARLLLKLWAEQANGQRDVIVTMTPARRRLLALGYVRLGHSHWAIKLTPAGREAARVLEASS